MEGDRRQVGVYKINGIYCTSTWHLIILSFPHPPPPPHSDHRQGDTQVYKCTFVHIDSRLDQYKMGLRCESLKHPEKGTSIGFTTETGISWQIFMISF